MKLLLLPTLLVFPQLAQAQLASALVREGDALLGAPAGHVVSSLSGVNTNQNNGYAVVLNSSDGVTTLSHTWGNGSSSMPGGLLLSEATYGSLVQTSFEGFHGVDDSGQSCISAGGTGGPAGSFDSVWVGTTPIAVEGDPIPSLPGKFWSFGSRPGITGGGVPYFVGGITSSSGGSTESRGLFYGSPLNVLLQGGDAVPGLPEVLDTASTVAFDYRFSGAGTNYLVEVKMVTSGALTTSNDNALVLSGSALMAGGSLVQEGVLIPVASGGDGVENWDNFDSVGVNEAGSYFFSGDSDGPTATDEMLVRDGVILFREGDVVDGQTLTGSIENAAMNEAGQLAYVWDIDVAGTALEALYFEDQLILVEGDAVDWNGDGVVDPTSTISDFTGIAAFGVTSDGTLIFTADVDVDGAGTLFEGLFAVKPGPTASAYCFGDGSGSPCPCGNPGGPDGGCANGTFANGATLEAAGSSSVAAGNLVLSGSRLPFGQPGLYFQGNIATNGGAGASFGDGLRCAGNTVIRLQVRAASGSGDSATTIDIGVAGGVGAGQVKRYQLWYRDPAGSPCGADFNLTNGIEVVWAP